MLGRFVLAAVIAFLPTVLLFKLFWYPLGVPTTVEAWPLEFSGIVVDRGGRIFVGVPGYGDVNLYSPTGQFVRRIDVHASGSGLWLELGPDDSLYVTGSRSSLTRQTYDRDGTWLGDAPRAGRPNWDSASLYAFATPGSDVYRIVGGYGDQRIVRSRTDGRVEVVVDRTLAWALHRSPGTALILLVIYFTMTIILFRIAEPSTRQRLRVRTARHV